MALGALGLEDGLSFQILSSFWDLNFWVFLELLWHFSCLFFFLFFSNKILTCDYN